MTNRTYRFAAFVLIVVNAVVVAGCGPIYLPGIYDTNMPAQAPLRLEKDHTYIGGYVGYSDGFNKDESHVMGRGDITWGVGAKGLRGVLDLGLHGGSYHVTQSNDTTERGHQSYLGLAFNGDVNVGLPLGDASIGIGTNLGLAVEFGPYANVYSDRRPPFALLLGAYMFVTYEVVKDQRLGFQAHVGLPGGSSFNLQYDFGQYVLWGGVGPSFASDSTMVLGRFMVGGAYRWQ
jgi:hypothetical protein